MVYGLAHEPDCSTMPQQVVTVEFFGFVAKLMGVDKFSIWLDEAKEMLHAASDYVEIQF
jgi:hypothetical protein